MATKRLLRHASDTISASKLVTFNCPAFDTITQLFLTFENSGAAATLANILAGVAKITILVNGEQILNASATDLNKVWQMLGTQVGNGTQTNSLPLFLGNLLYKLPESESLFDLGCDKYTQNTPVTNIQVQIQFGSSVTGLTDVSLYSERVAKGLGQNTTKAICKLLTYAQTGSVGTNEVDTLPRDSAMGRLFTLAVQGTAVISVGEALVNNDPVVQNADLNTNGALLLQRGFVQPSGTFAYCFSDGGMVNSLLSMEGVTDFRLKTTLTTGGSYDLVDCTVRVVA